MAKRIVIDEQTLGKLRRAGEVRVQSANGLPLVVMTVEARERLQRLAYDDSDWTEAESRAAGADQLDDPEGWGAEGMDVYDELDLAAARKALMEKGRISWAEVKKGLRLK